MKLMYMTDPHLKGRNPARRLDDYPSEVLMFFEEAKQIAIKEDLQAVLIGGDIFDTPKISQRLYNKLVRILNDFPCEVIAVPGNHDIFGMNADNLEDTMLASLEASGLIQLLSEDRPYVQLGDKHGNFVRLHGKEFTSDRDHGDLTKDFCIPDAELGNHWNFLLTHCMLLDKPFHPDVAYTLIDDVKDITNADIIFGAHYHPGWGIIEHDNVVFIHPGGTARLEGTKREATRPVQYAMIEIEADGTLNHSLETFKSARPGADILDIVSNVAAKAHKNQLEVFRKTVDDAALFENQDPHTILVDIAKAQGIDKDIQNLALRAIIQAEKDSDELNTGLKGFVESPTPISLEWIELENFQAHGKTRFDFDGTGLNAIIGASDSGKTAVVRGLRWLLYNDPKGTEFIRFGESRATVRAHFSNGKTIERSRTQSSAGHYRITDSAGDTQEYTGFSHNVPIEVMNAHQMPKTQLSKDVESSLNISYQLDGSFLIGESTSTRASVIGRLTGVHIVDAAIRETNKKVLNIQRDIKADLREEESLTERLATEFTDLPDLQDEVNQLDLLIAHGQKLEKKLTELQDIETQYVSVCDTIQKSTKGLVEIVPRLASAQAALTKAERKQGELIHLNKLAEDLQDTDNVINDATTKLKQYRGLKKIAGEIEDSQDVARRLTDLKVIDDELFSKDAEIRKSEMKLAGLPNISIEELDDIQTSIDALKTLRRIEDDIDHQIELIKDADAIFVTLNLNIDSYSQQYKTVLKEMGKCPTCYTPIDDTIIDRIELQ